MFKHIAGGLLIGVGFLLAIFIVLRLSVTYRLQSDLVKLLARLDAHEAASEQLKKEVIVRIDDLERTLFGEVKPLAQENAKRPKQPVSRLEAWMMNSNKDLRERLDRLERQVRELR